MKLPIGVNLGPREHCDLPTVPDHLAGEMGQLIVAVSAGDRVPAERRPGPAGQVRRRRRPPAPVPVRPAGADAAAPRLAAARLGGEPPAGPARGPPGERRARRPAAGRHRRRLGAGLALSYTRDSCTTVRRRARLAAWPAVPPPRGTSSPLRRGAPDRNPSDELAELLMAFHHPIRRWLTELLGSRGSGERRSAGRRHRPGRRLGQPPPQGAAPAGPDRAGARARPRHPRELVEAQASLDDVERRGLRRGHPRPAGGPDGRGGEPPLPGPRDAGVAAARARTSRRAGAWPQPPPTPTCPPPRSRCGTSPPGLSELFRDWSAECMTAAEENPDAARRPVRAIARVFPSEPVRP